MSTYSVGVIGLGKIAAMYGTPAEPFPYCHVGGIRHSQRVRLVAVADAAEAARTRFLGVWGAACPGLAVYPSAAALYAAGVPDILAICVRGPAHHAVTLEAIAAGPKAIFLEKPPSCSLAELDELLAAAQARRIPLIVSYSRHWRPHVLRLQELVGREGLIGQVQMVVGYVGGSVLSFASHVTDLICQFAGYAPTAVYARGKSSSKDLPPGYEAEPTLDSMQLEFANGVVGVQVGAGGEHGGFYCDVFGSRGYARAGMYLPPFARDQDRKPIDLSALGMPPDASVFTVAYDQIAAHLDGGPLPHCCNQDVVAVNELGFGAIESILTHQRVTLPNQNRTRKVFANG